MPITLGLTVLYSQVAVFHSGLARPFSRWTDRHVKQGFALRADAVSFRTLANSGRHLVEVAVAEGNEQLSSEAIRIIQTPFKAPPTGTIEIACIAAGFAVE